MYYRRRESRKWLRTNASVSSCARQRDVLYTSSQRREMDGNAVDPQVYEEMYDDEVAKGLGVQIVSMQLGA